MQKTEFISRPISLYTNEVEYQTLKLTCPRCGEDIEVPLPNRIYDYKSAYERICDITDKLLRDLRRLQKELDECRNDTLK